MEKISHPVFFILILLQIKCIVAENLINSYAENFIDIDQQLFNHSPEPTEKPTILSGELQENEEDGCYLLSFEEDNKATYLCHEGITWTVSIVDSADGGCVYRRNVTDTSDHSDLREMSVDCHQGKAWLQHLVQTEIIPGIPDTPIFDTNY